MHPQGASDFMHSLLNCLMDKFQPYREVVLKGCKVVKFSRGGQYWAAAANIHVLVWVNEFSFLLVMIPSIVPLTSWYFSDRFMVPGIVIYWLHFKGIWWASADSFGIKATIAFLAQGVMATYMGTKAFTPFIFSFWCIQLCQFLW